jgi:hypothetical protein
MGTVAAVIVALLIGIGGTYAVMHTDMGPEAAMTDRDGYLEDNRVPPQQTPTEKPSTTVGGKTTVKKSGTVSPTGSYPDAVTITSVTPSTGKTGGLISIQGKGFVKNLSRVNFYQNGKFISSIQSLISLSPDGTLLQFKLDEAFVTNSLNSNVGTYQLEVANVDCGSGVALQCLTNVSSNLLNFTYSK